MLWWLSVALSGSLQGYHTAYLSTPGLVFSPRSGGFAGDLNHDGVSEVWMGARRALIGGWDGGGMELYLGSSARVSTPWAWFVGDGRNANLGAGVAFGDVNGDGEIDVLVGQSGRLPGNPWYVMEPARLHVWFGPIRQQMYLASSSDRVIESVEICDGDFGPLVPDVTGDGLPDIIITRSNRDGLPSQVLVVDLGRASRPGPRVRPLEPAIWGSFEGDSPGDMQREVQLVGDLDQDGLPEVAWEHAGSLGWQRWVVEGRALGAGGVVAVADVGRGLAEAGPINPAGDVDRDGVPDIIITSKAFYAGARIVGGRDVMAIAPGQVARESDYGDLLEVGYFGVVSEAIGIGDVNGDGFDDWALGEVNETPGLWFVPPEGPGSVWIGLGDGTIRRTTGKRAAVGEAFTSPVLAPGAVAPWLAVGQDCDGDQLPDLLVPAEVAVGSQWAMLCY